MCRKLFLMLPAHMVGEALGDVVITLIVPISTHHVPLGCHPILVSVPFNDKCWSKRKAELSVHYFCDNLGPSIAVQEVLCNRETQ